MNTYYQPISYLNDSLFKSFLDLKDEDSRMFVKTLLYLICGIEVEKIEKVDRELNRINQDSKSSRVDFIAYIDGRYVNIEIQKTLSLDTLLPRIQVYQSQVFSSLSLKGVDPATYPEIISIIFYEGVYIKDERLLSKYEYRCFDRESDPYNRMTFYLIELGKINQIFQSKNIHHMSNLEKICFAIKNSDNPRYYGILKLLEDHMKEVSFMKRRVDLFRSDIADYMTAFNAELNETSRMYYFKKEGKAEGRLEGKIEGKKELLKSMIEHRYHQDASFYLESLSNERIQEITELLFENLSYEAFIEKIKSTD